MYFPHVADAGTNVRQQCAHDRPYGKSGEAALRPSSATGLLQALEEDGYIRRVPVARDARLKKIVLMPKAEKIQLNVNKNHKQMQRQLQGPMTDEEVAAFMDTCDALAERASTF